MKKGQVFKCQDIQNRENRVTKVIRGAGKATGNNKTWYSLSFLEPDSFKGAEISVDLSKLHDLEILESKDVVVLTDVSFEQAKHKELLSWKNNNVHVYVEKTNNGEKFISTRLICTLSHERTKHKARLVAREFEEANKEHIPKTRQPVVQTLQTCPDCNGTEELERPHLEYQNSISLEVRN